MSGTRGRRFETVPFEHSGEPLRRLDPDDAEAALAWLQSEIAERGIPVFFQAQLDTDNAR